MDRNIFKTGVLGLALAVTLGACNASTGGGPTSAASANSSEATAGAAVGSLFGNQSEGASLKKAPLPYRLVALMVKSAHAQQTFSACDMAQQAPADVITSASVTAGTYGASFNPATVAATDDCEDGGEYAGFSVASHTMVCTDGENNQTTITMTNSVGAFKENLTANQTEIFGTFNMQIGSGEDMATVSDLGCSLTIGHGTDGSSGVFGGGCDDGEGGQIEPSNDVSCTDS